MSAADASAQLVAPVRWRAWEVVLWVAIWIAPFALPQYAALINEIAIFALFAVSLDIVLGYAGIVSLGHAAFFGAGGYASALLAKHLIADPLVGLALGTAVGAVLGALTSPMIVRGTDLTRLMVTMGVALVLLELANKFDNITGGADGLQGVVTGPLLGVFEFDLAARTAFDAQRHIVGRDDAAEALDQTVGLQDDVGHGPVRGDRANQRHGRISRSRPTSIRTTRNRPIQNVQYCGVIALSRSCSTLNAIAPASPPHSQPAPPITSASMTSALRWKSSRSSDANPVVCESSAPAAPAIAAPSV